MLRCLTGDRIGYQSSNRAPRRSRRCASGSTNVADKDETDCQFVSWQFCASSARARIWSRKRVKHELEGCEEHKWARVSLMLELHGLTRSVAAVFEHHIGW